VSTIFENCRLSDAKRTCDIDAETFPGLNNFIEPNNILYDVPMPSVDEAVGELKPLLRVGPKEAVIVHRAREKRVDRTEAVNEAAELAVRECAIHSNNKHSQSMLHS